MRNLCVFLLCALVASAAARCDFSHGFACQGGQIQTLQFDDDDVTFMEAHSECTIYQQGKFSVDDDEIEIDFPTFLGIDLLDCDIIGEDGHDCECYDDKLKFQISDSECTTLLGPHGEVCTPAKNSQECNFRTCPAGQQLVTNPDYQSSANGCGPASFPITAPSFSFFECCEQHDYCYGDCVDSKEKCDNDFYECMYCSCQDDSAIERFFCEELACLYYESVETFGCAAFEASQGQGCICSGSKNATIEYTEIPSKFGPIDIPERSTRAVICPAPFSVPDSVCRARTQSNILTQSNPSISGASSLVISCFVLLVVALLF